MFEVEKVSCPLCGSGESEGFLKDVPELYVGTGHLFDITRCCRCGFCYTNPRPCKKDIGYFYPDTAGYYSNKSDVSEIEGRFKGVVGFCKKFVLSRAFGYRHILPALFWFPSFLVRPFAFFGDADIPEYRDGGRLLEVGCSTGVFLKKMADLGWSVVGVEMNATAAAFAREELGLQDIRTGFFEDCSFGKTLFHVAKASMVLEHVYEPRGFVQKVHRALVSGGKFIFSVPDIKGLEIAWYGRHAYCLHVPQHLNHFSVKTITKLLNEEGFEVERIRHHSFDRDMVASANYAGRVTLYNILRFPLVRKLLVQPFVWFAAFLGKTSRMTVYARKR